MSVVAASRLPGWHAHPDVWLLIAVGVAAYAVAVTRLGPRHAEPGRPAVSRRHVACFAAGIVTLWLVSDWPIHDLAEGSTYSVHMVQHLLLTLVAVPLLLLGIPAWMGRAILGPPSRRFRLVRRLCRFVPALVIFNAVLVLTHWPAVVDASLSSGVLHLGLHVLLFASSVLVWMPVLSPVPEIPRLAPLPRMLFLFSQSVVPTVPASFLTFGRRPLYPGYEGLPHIWGLSTLDDQQLAGLIMKIGGGLLLWLLIAVVFFRWAAEEEGRDRSAARRGLEHELARMEV